MYQFILHNILYYLLGSSTVHTGSSRRGTTRRQNYYGLGVHGFEFASTELANSKIPKARVEVSEGVIYPFDFWAFGCGFGSR